MFQNRINGKVNNKPLTSKENLNDLDEENRPNVEKFVKPSSELSFEFISKNWKMFLNEIQIERPSIKCNA